MKPSSINPFNPCSSAGFEICQARSALNMPPEPDPDRTLAKYAEADGREPYLSETDKWVRHASEHLMQAQEAAALGAQNYRDLARAILGVARVLEGDESPEDKLAVIKFRCDLAQRQVPLSDEI